MKSTKTMFPSACILLVLLMGLAPNDAVAQDEPDYAMFEMIYLTSAYSGECGSWPLLVKAISRFRA